MSTVNFSTRLLSVHKSYLHHFTNRKVQMFGSFIGGWWGFPYLLEYYSTVKTNNAIDAWNAVANKKKIETNSSVDETQKYYEYWVSFGNVIDEDKENNDKDNNSCDTFDVVKEIRKSMDESKTKYKQTLEKYPNPFGLVISQQASLPFNLLTTVISGSVCGYFFATYYPFCIISLIIHNSLNSSKTSKTNDTIKK